MKTETPGIQWVDETTLRVTERDRRLTISLSHFCLGALPALLLLQGNAPAVVIVPAAALGLAYSLFWFRRSLRMEFVAGPEGIVIRGTKKTRRLPWSEVDSFIDAFIAGDQGRIAWALGIKTIDGSIVVADMTGNGKARGRESTVQALRSIAWRHGIEAQLTGDAANSSTPTKAGWHPDPGGADGVRFFTGAIWGPVRRHRDPGGIGTFESWDPLGDPVATLELYKTEAHVARSKRNRWIAISVVLTIVACALFDSENHKGGHFTFAAIAGAGAAFCAWRVWGLIKQARALTHMVALAARPGPVPVGGVYVSPTSPAAGSPSADGVAAAGAEPNDAAPADFRSTDFVMSAKRDRMAVWSLVCSIAGWVTLGLSAVVGIILGLKARRRLRNSGGLRRDVRLATAGIVIGSLCLVFLIGFTVAAQFTPDPTGSPNVALAQLALLRPSDYGAGWRNQGAGSGTFEASFFNSFSAKAVWQMAACLDMSPGRVDTKPTEVVGHEFAGPSKTLWLSDTTDVFPRVAAAAADAEAAASAKAATCEQLLQVNHQWGVSMAQWYFGSSTTSGPVTVVRRQGVPTLPSGASDLEAAVPYKATHSSATLYIDMILLRRGRVESNIWVADANTQPPIGRINDLVTAARHRLASTNS
jgi:hypothetical protein